MVALALAALASLAPGRFAPDLTLSPPDTVREPAADRRDPCAGREGWLGDGEDGRAPPACDGVDVDLDADAAGLHAPDWLGMDDDGDADDAG